MSPLWCSLGPNTLKNLSPAQCGGAERVHQIEKAARLAAADIVDAAVSSLPPQPQHRRDAILDVDEVAPLLAVAVVGAMRFEEPDRLATLVR